MFIGRPLPRALIRLISIIVVCLVLARMIWFDQQNDINKSRDVSAREGLSQPHFTGALANGKRNTGFFGSGLKLVKSGPSVKGTSSLLHEADSSDKIISRTGKEQNQEAVRSLSTKVKQIHVDRNGTKATSKYDGTNITILKSGFPDRSQNQTNRSEKTPESIINVKPMEDMSKASTSKDQHMPCIKKIHIYGNFSMFSHVPELTGFKYLLKRNLNIRCTPRGYKCNIKLTIGVDLAMFTGKDAVVFGMVGPQWRRNTLLQELLEVDPEPGQTWVFYSTEPPYRYVNWNENTDITRLKYHILMTYHPDSEIHIPFGIYRPFKNDSDPDPTGNNAVKRTKALKELDKILHRNRTGLLSWAASNCREVFWPRMEFVQRFRDLHAIDDYGACGRLECFPKRSEKCVKLFASYRFYLAIENSECDHFITEKVWETSLSSGVVPVVLGARKKDYEKVAPPNSFIHFSDFGSINELVDYLIKLSKDDKLYASYHAWRQDGQADVTYPLPANSFCRILPHLKTRSPEDIKLLGDSSYYNSCRELPGKRIVKSGPMSLTNWSVWK